jgi:hypothetical protein
MSRGHLYSNDYRPQFSGHETFPLRYGWLKKAYDFIEQNIKDQQNKALFSSDSSIATLGVGRNMVSSMRYWAQASGIIEEVGANALAPTKIGRCLFGAGGLDPFIENASTLWLLHWNLCSRPDRTTWYWAFNHFQSQAFEREVLVKDLLQLAASRGWPRVAVATVKRDVECFVRAYAARSAGARGLHEEALESPLAELGLLKSIGKKDGFRFVRGEHSSLNDGVFAYALMRFWELYSPTSSSLSFEAVAHEPGSPGRVFCLDEADLSRRLADIADVTAGAVLWSETAGLKQLSRRRRIDAEGMIKLLEVDFTTPNARRAA